MRIGNGGGYQRVDILKSQLDHLENKPEGVNVEIANVSIYKCHQLLTRFFTYAVS